MRELKFRSAFASKAAAGHGLGVEAAVAAAQARVDDMRGEAMAQMGAIVGRMQAARPAVAAGATDPNPDLEAAADALVGLGGLFELPELAAAALSLCALFDKAKPDAPSSQAIAVHIDAVQLFWSATAAERAVSFEPVMKGLSRVAALPQKRS